MKKFLFFGLLLSYGSAFAGEQSISEAFRSCVNQFNSESGLRLVRSESETKVGRLSILCNGNEARKLFEAVQSYAQEKDLRIGTSLELTTRTFGQLEVPSQCMREKWNPSGEEPRYSCNLRIDLLPALVDAVSPRGASRSKPVE